MRMFSSSSKRLAAIALLAVFAIPLGGCSFFSKLRSGVGGIFSLNHENDYGQVHKKLDSDSSRYVKALDEITEWTTERPEGATGDGPWRRRREGIITEPQWRLFSAGVENVRTANASVKLEMDDWGATGVRPAMLSPHIDALVKAQNEVIKIVRTVKP